MKKKLYVLALAISLFAMNITAQTTSTFKQWGDELYVIMKRDLKHSSFNYLYRENTTTNRSAAYAWPMGIMIKALIYANKTNEAEGLTNEFHSNYISTARGYTAYNAVKGGSNDRYYDDNAWIAKDLVDLYVKTQKTDYLNKAKTIMQFCMSGERLGRTFNIQVKDKTTGLLKDTTVVEALGGVRFHENNSSLTTSEGYFNTSFNNFAWCATAPITVVNLKIYQQTHEESYLTDGKRLYNSMKTIRWGIGPGYRGYENAVVLQAALYLYEITGEQTYLLDAQQLGYSMNAVYISWKTQRLNEYGRWGGHDMTDAYVHLYNVDHNPYWLTIAGAYTTFLRNKCMDSQGYYPEEWNDTSKNISKVIALVDQASALAAFYKMATTQGAEPRIDEPVVVFKESDYNATREGGNFSIGLKLGKYTQNDLTFLGHTNNRFVFSPQISSVLVKSGYKVTFYSRDNFTGDSIVYEQDTPFMSGWIDKTVSLKVEVNPNQTQPVDDESDYKPISTFEELNAIRNNRIVDTNDSNKPKITGKYYLTNDITIPEGVEWIPIGALFASDTDPAAFNGIFDGKGHSIINLKTGTSGLYNPFKGLFARLMGAKIKNVDLSNVAIKGSSPVGAIAGSMYSGTSIEQVSVTGTIEANGVHVGGIVGRSSQSPSLNYNLINNCYVNATIKTTDSHVGGIVGQLQSASSGQYSRLRIQNVYVRGRVQANTVAVGNNAAGIIALTQSTSLDLAHLVVACDAIVGATPNLYFSRDQYPGLFLDNHTRSDIALNYLSATDQGKGAETKYQAVKHAQTDFTRKSFYEGLGWDFTNVWKISEGEYPTLQYNMFNDVDNVVKSNFLSVSVVYNAVNIQVTQPADVAIYTLTGQLVCQQKINDVASLSLSKGAYVLHAKSLFNTITRKIVVK